MEKVTLPISNFKIEIISKPQRKKKQTINTHWKWSISTLFLKWEQSYIDKLNQCFIKAMEKIMCSNFVT